MNDYNKETHVYVKDAKRHNEELFVKAKEISNDQTFNVKKEHVLPNYLGVNDNLRQFKQISYCNGSSPFTIAALMLAMFVGKYGHGKTIKEILET